MFSFREFIIFLAGAEFFHTVSHLILPFFIHLPYETKYVVLTQTLNFWAIVFNGIITLALILWAKRLPR